MGIESDGYAAPMPGDELIHHAVDQGTADPRVRVEPATKVSLRFPASISSIRLARLVGSGVGAQLGLDVVAIEDLRLVVDEACAITLECSVVDGADRPLDEAGPDAAATLDLGISWTDDAVFVEVERPGAITGDVPSSISAAILDATATSWQLHRPKACVSVVMARGRP